MATTQIISDKQWASPFSFLNFFKRKPLRTTPVKVNDTFQIFARHSKYPFLTSYTRRERAEHRLPPHDIRVLRLLMRIFATRNAETVILYGRKREGYIEDVLASVAARCRALTEIRFIRLDPVRFERGVYTPESAYVRVQGIIEDIAMLQIATSSRCVLVIRNLDHYVRTYGWAFPMLLKFTRVRGDVVILGAMHSETGLQVCSLSEIIRPDVSVLVNVSFMQRKKAEVSREQACKVAEFAPCRTAVLRKAMATIEWIDPAMANMVARPDKHLPRVRGSEPHGQYTRQVLPSPLRIEVFL
ncbi:uncharacterized protein V1518DRAFT_423125, partial [Limtongia smithiae]|uniref:uncharacterized protein n=1 Tax=Limtongia smithiae TaxID=1125753 RepID=UPI0034CD1DB4